MTHDLYCTVQEHYLPHIIRAKLKLACSGVDDSKFTDFLNNSLKEAERKELLESRYCTELALYSIIRGDLDRAKYYNDNSLQLFLQVSNIIIGCKKVITVFIHVCVCGSFPGLVQLGRTAGEEQIY